MKYQTSNEPGQEILVFQLEAVEVEVLRDERAEPEELFGQNHLCQPTSKGCERLEL